MLLSLLYLAANVATLGVLLSAKYYRMWAMLCLQVAVTCWQVAIWLFVPVSDRTMVIKYCLPGDFVLVLVSAAAVLEVLWRSMRGFPTANKIGVCVYSCIAFHFAGISMRWLLGMPRYSDWFVQVKADRAIVNVCIATMAIIAAGIAHTFNRHNDPRYVRFHGTIVAVLACGHVLLSDMSQWSASHTAYRALATACCFGWMINANLLGREWRLANRDESDPVRISIVPSPASLPEVAHSRDGVAHCPARPERGGFGSRRRWAGAALRPAYLPEVPVETR